MKGKLHFAVACLMVAAVFSSVIGLSQAASSTNERPQRINVLIGFRQTPGRNEQALVRSHGGTVKYSYHLVPAIAASIPEPAVKALLSNPRVTSVEPDGMVYAVDIELENSWGVKRIGSGTVHDSGNRGTGVKVAIIDSGVDYTHPDLNDNFDPSNLGHDFVDTDTDPMDVYGHGTHVAGTACAEDNNNGIDDETGKFGVVGVAPECALYSLRVLNADGAGYWSDIIAAMQWAVDNNLQVANLSLGSSRDPGGTVKAAFDNAEAMGLLIVAAAGNDGKPSGRGNNVIYPAKYDSVVAVAATDSNDQRASWSSTGDQVELAAPGVSVYSAWNDNTSPYDPQPVCHSEEDTTACYKYGSGTSMASPHVAGAGALVIATGISDTNGDSRINDEVRQVLDATADDLGDTGRDPHYGFGLVNAAAAVGAVVPPKPVTDIAITAVEAPSSVVQGDVVGVEVTVKNGGNQNVSSDINVILTDETDAVSIGSQLIFGGLQAGASVVVSFSWDTLGATIGDHTLTASHDFTDDDDTNNSKSTTVGVSEEPAPQGLIHVSSIEVWYEAKGPNYFVYTRVSVEDENKVAVSGATVYSTMTLPDGSIASGSGETNGDGKVVFKLRSKQTGTYTSTVTDVVKEGWTYDSGANVETSESRLVP